jgi:hypothetical protein
VPDPLDQAWREVEAALEAFRRIAKKAVEVAKDPRSTKSQFEDARVQATFGLASVGSAFKRALHVAADGTEGGDASASPRPDPRVK